MTKLSVRYITRHICSFYCALDVFYTYVADGTEYDDMGRDPAALPRFCSFIRQGRLLQTSLVNVAA